MSISQIEFLKIVTKLSLQQNTIDYDKIQNAVEIVNVAFLKVAVNKLENLLNRSNNKNRDNILYNCDIHKVMD